MEEQSPKFESSFPRRTSEGPVDDVGKSPPASFYRELLANKAQQPQLSEDEEDHNPKDFLFKEDSEDELLIPDSENHNSSSTSPRKFKVENIRWGSDTLNGSILPLNSQGSNLQSLLSNVGELEHLLSKDVAKHSKYLKEQSSKVEKARANIVTNLTRLSLVLSSIFNTYQAKAQDKQAILDKIEEWEDEKKSLLDDMKEVLSTDDNADGETHKFLELASESINVENEIEALETRLKQLKIKQRTLKNECFQSQGIIESRLSNFVQAVEKIEMRERKSIEQVVQQLSENQLGYWNDNLALEVMNGLTINPGDISLVEEYEPVDILKQVESLEKPTIAADYHLPKNTNKQASRFTRQLLEFNYKCQPKLNVYPVVGLITKELKEDSAKEQEYKHRYDQVTHTLSALKDSFALIYHTEQQLQSITQSTQDLKDFQSLMNQMVESLLKTHSEADQYNLYLAKDVLAQEISIIHQALNKLNQSTEYSSVESDNVKNHDGLLFQTFSKAQERTKLPSIKSATSIRYAPSLYNSLSPTSTSKTTAKGEVNYDAGINKYTKVKEVLRSGKGNKDE
ncbi:Autophagy related protein [Komagataella phaffii CBS 7435]|nr:Predicted protein [Komagataella phaffii CBS 7435]CCA38376.1 Autophagy related protein [Komagataella phaffii CBS 7435]